MEAFSMPQLEKSASLYSDTQCQSDEPANRRQAQGNAKKYVGPVAESLPLLTSSAWSAVIHRPAEEDSEPDDLPSTVDMDAIKGSPTGLAPPSKPAAECCERARRRGADDASDSSDDDSDSSDDSDSGSDSGSESGSCSWSESDSGSTSCSSRSCSSQASRVHQTFSIRETNIDQGGLKLKISALKIPRKAVTKEPSRYSDVESKRRESPLEKQFKEKPPAEKKEEAASPEVPQSASKVQRVPSAAAKCAEASKPRADASTNQVPSSVTKVDKAPPASLTAKPDRNPVPKPDKGPSAAAKGAQNKAEKCQAAKVDRQQPLPPPVKLVKGSAAAAATKCVKAAKADKVQASKGTASERSPARGGNNRAARSDTSRGDNRRKDAALGRHKVSGVGGGRGVYNMRLPGCAAAQRPAARAASPRSCSSDSEHEGGGGIAQLARQLVGTAAAGQENIAISEHLQVINQEDLAAILPDVVPAADDGGCGAPFDGFEDVSSESGKAAQRGTESSSDVELPEQVVSAAIERIQLGADHDGDSSSGGSGDDESAAAVGHPYSSSLLQQFVEKTKLLSCQATETAKASEAPKRRKRGRPPKAAKRPPEMEAYMQLDLSVSNVSPDSGIQSVAGSPPRRSVSPPARPVASPPVSHQEHTKARPKFAEIRRGPGRPKKVSLKKKAMNSDFASGTDSCDEATPVPSSNVAVKRGPGRPKKNTSAFEAIAAVPRGEEGKKEIMSSIEKMMKADKGKRKERKGGDAMVGAKQKSSTMLNEICERVSKRLDMPIHDVTSYPLKLAKVRLSKDYARDGKARRKRRGADDGRHRRFSSSSPGDAHPRPPAGSSTFRPVAAPGPPRARVSRPTLPTMPARPRLTSRPHKHKKRKRKAKQLKTVRLPEDPALLTDLERLASLFRRACTIAASKHGCGGGTLSRDALPSIFRVKRVGKRRKGAEKATPPAGPSERDSAGEDREKRRRVKKSTVEPPKGHHERTEPANNEQRLPLKKRHYHMSVPSASTPSQDSPSSEKPSEKTSAKVSPEGTRKSVSGERAAEKVGEKPLTKSEKAGNAANKNGQIDVKAKPIAETHRNSRSSVNSERLAEKVCDRLQVKAEKTVNSGKVQAEKAKVVQDLPRKSIESSRKSASSERNASDAKAAVKVDKAASLPNKVGQETKASEVAVEPARNSIDEAIEACINKYSSPTVATTPKKRHRLVNPASTSPRNSTTTKAKETDARTSNATPQPSKRSTSRSASAANASPQESKPVEGIFEPSKTAPAPPVVPATRTVLSSKPISPTNKANIQNTLANTEAAAIETVPALNAGKNATPTIKVVNNAPLDKLLCKPLTVSVENLMENVVASPRNGLARSAKSPRLSPSTAKTASPKVVEASVSVLVESPSEVAPSHNLRLKRANGAPVEEPAPKPSVKKRKITVNPDVQIQVTKVDPTESTFKESAAVSKKKVRRRKAINRTGFPVKKKKKKKANTMSETAATFEVEDCEALIPKSIISVINKDDLKSSLGESFKISDIVEADAIEASESDKRPASQLDETISRVIENKDDLAIDGGFSQKQLEMDLSVLEPEVLLYERTRKQKRIATEANEPKNLAQFPLLKRCRKAGREDDADSDIVLPDDAPSCDESTKSSGIRKKQPRWRKKYLVAGLFSDYYKEEEPRGDGVKVPRSQTYKPEEHKYGLLPPPYHCGKYIRQRKVEFKLPYDMWWQHMHSQLPGRDLVPSWNYKKIRTNVYYDVKPSYGYEAQACNCAMSSVKEQRGCGEDCINRVVYSECSPQLCPCAEYCANQKIQRHEWAPTLDKFMTKEKGWGVKTKQLIRSGEFILEYVGEVVSEKEFKERMASRYMLDTHHYCLNLDGGLVIDGHRMGGDGRFVNHSCEPNCEMQKWSVNGLFRMALFALRDISPDEELSYDYNFSLFNPAEGQPCKCGSDRCRGVIGGKSQRVNGPLPQGASAAADSRGLTGRPRKNLRKSGKQRKRNNPTDLGARAPARPMSHQQRCFAQAHHCFLLRNLEKVKRVRERQKEACRREQAAAAACARPPPKHVDVFLTQLTALSSPRNMRTRRLAQAEDNPELTKTARLAYVFRDLYNVVINAKDEVGEMLASPFTTLPTKRKLPAYYQRVQEPIDLTMLEQNIVTGFYRNVEAFDADMLRLFANNVRFFGRTSELGIVATRLRKVYNLAKADFLGQLEEILGESAPANFIPEHDPGGEEEDVIRCICGLYKDEGTMIQCERCLVWQHCDCVRADQSLEHYLCERCDRRVVDLEIRLEETPPYATPGLEYYVTLLRGTLQLRQGDTVYVLRDMDEEGTPASQPPVKVTYKTVKEVKYTDLDIFRVERLWKDEKGDRFAFGHHFLRPHETYHEPSRKFFPNEVMRVPLYEVVPVELIMGQCWVLDVNTYCKGRPAGVPEQHVYVCEYRVDKSAHLFTRIAKPRYPVCTKSYAFDSFDVRVKPIRTYTPHGRVAIRSRGPRGTARDGIVDEAPATPQPPQTQSHEDDEEHIPLARVRAALAAKRASQKLRLNSVLLKLLARLPSKQPLDVSYLLEPGRRHRKKAAVLNT